MSRYEADYTSTVEHVWIMTSYYTWLDGAHISTSVASFELETLDGTPGSEIAIVNGCGHGIPLQRPEWFSKRVTHWLSKS